MQWSSFNSSPATDLAYCTPDIFTSSASPVVTLHGNQSPDSVTSPDNPANALLIHAFDTINSPASHASSHASFVLQ